MYVANGLRPFSGKEIKKLLLLIFAVSAMLANIEAYAKNTYRPKTPHTYITGPRGGCYYINSHGKKTYVDRALCADKNIRSKKI
jgi:hypothetical protein